MKQVSYGNVKPGGFWQKRFETNKAETIPMIYNRFTDMGRFESLKCNWKEGMPNRPFLWWDSDVAKWIEAVAYTIKLSPDVELEKLADAAIDDIAANQWEDGYVNSYFTTVEPENRFRKRSDHELYCAGHLTEAAVAYYEATGKDKLLRVMEKYMDCIEKHFIIDKSAGFNTPGHEEIELALDKLYNCTGNKKYLEMCRYFIETRGKGPNEHQNTYDWCDDDEYNQTDAPVRELKDAHGHSVRAVYLFCGMADLARETGDRSLFEACDRLFDSAAGKKMYITGGIGSASYGEQFANDYFLPNDVAYSETCASIGLAFFARRMSLIEPNSKYDDAAELAIYNCALSGVSLSGREFFYVNPLEINIARYKSFKKYYKSNENLLTHRIEFFECSCCPPNLARMVASIGDFLYSYDDDTVYVHHFMESEAEWDGIKIVQQTEYPNEGSIKFTVSGMKGKTLAVRIPGWTKCVSLNGEKLNVKTEKGFAYIPVAEDEQVLDMCFEMKARLVSANPNVDFDTGRVCLCRGPLVYCAESILNDGVKLNNIVLDSTSPVSLEFNEQVNSYEARMNAFEDKPFEGLYRDYDPDGYTEREIRFLPYYAFANNGESDMIIWMRHN